MKTSIFYFTGTGNSLYVAKYISKNIEDSEVIAIPKFLNKEQFETDSERIGIVFPLYYGGLPEIVIEFLQKIKIRRDAYIFAIATKAMSKGHAMNQIDELLLKRETSLNSGFYLTMPGNYIKMYNMKSKGTAESIIKKANSKMDSILEQIKKRENTKIDESALKCITKKLYSNFIEKVHTEDAKFYVTNDCSECGLCEKICPVNNITMKDGKPVWNHNCQDCMACIQLCPNKAVQIGKRTIRRRRYKNPYIDLKEIIDQK